MTPSFLPPAARVLLVLALGLGACGHDHDHDHNYGDGAIPDRPDGAFLCVDLGPLCHDVDPGSGPLHECHEQGHNAEPAWCAANLSRCVALCTAARDAADAGPAPSDAGPAADTGVDCASVGSICHDVDPGSGPLHDCHEGGHNPQPDWCAANAQRCIDLCNAARADAGASSDGGHSHGDGGQSHGDGGHH